MKLQHQSGFQNIFTKMLCAAAALVAGSVANADEVPWTIDCAEIVHAEANEAMNGYNVKKEKSFNLTFSRVDNDNWIMTGNAGSVPVVTVDGPGVIHFLESTPFGTINITQVMLRGDSDAMQGVHSRHSVLIDAMAPSQWLLECSVR